MTKDELIELAEKRGFTLFMTHTGGGDNTRWLFIDTKSYVSLRLDETGWFELYHTIPTTIISLNTEGRRNFDKEEYFNEIYQQFKQLVITCHVRLGVAL